MNKRIIECMRSSNDIYVPFTLSKFQYNKIDNKLKIVTVPLKNVINFIAVKLALYNNTYNHNKLVCQKLY